jgi:nitroreductase
MAATETAELLWDKVPVPETTTTVYQALLQRRMAWKYEDRDVPRDALERMLSTSVWAPNHKHTEPWRFFISTKDSAHRQKIAEFARAGIIARNSEDTNLAERQRQWVLSQPLIVFAYSVPGIHDDMTRENYASVVCALHNVSLAGVAEGLAVTWETGGIAKLPGLTEAVGGESDWQLVAMATVGYPDEESPSSRTPVSEFVTWAE